MSFITSTLTFTWRSFSYQSVMLPFKPRPNIGWLIHDYEVAAFWMEWYGAVHRIGMTLVKYKELSLCGMCVVWTNHRLTFHFLLFYTRTSSRVYLCQPYWVNNNTFNGTALYRAHKNNRETVFSTSFQWEKQSKADNAVKIDRNIIENKCG